MKMSMKKGNAGVVSTTSTDTVLSKEKTVSDGERATYMLLADHPYFIEGLAKVRRRMGIPREGFTNGERAFEWEHTDKFNKKELWDVMEKLVAEFTIKSAFITDVKFFVYGYALSPKIVENQLPLSAWLPNKEETIKQVGRHKIGAKLILTGKDIERSKYQFKTNALYLEITDQTTVRDVSTVMKEATKRKKDLRPFAVSKVEAVARRVWHLKKEKISDKNVAKLISQELGRPFGDDEVPAYHKRYRDALQELKPFSKQ